MKFKVGDRVKVVHGSKEYFLEYDTIYIIKSTRIGAYGNLMVGLKGCPNEDKATLYAHRFELVSFPEVNLVNHPEYKELFT